MKKIYLIFLCFLTFTFMSCLKESHYDIPFYNSTDYTIYVDVSFDHPDTTLRQMQDVTTSGWFLDIKPHKWGNPLDNMMTTYESEFHGMDTLIIFVFNSDTLATYGWENVKDDYLISQRYDLSLNDLKRMNWHLSFPPTEEMRNIKMWPPYGTYDPLGHRRE